MGLSLDSLRGNLTAETVEEYSAQSENTYSSSNSLMITACACRRSRIELMCVSTIVSYQHVVYNSSNNRLCLV